MDNNKNNAKVIISIEDLSCHYGDKLALRNINLDVLESEIMVIMGHSGSGKSTLFRSVLGLLPPSSGSVKVLDKDVFKLKKKVLY